MLAQWLDHKLTHEGSGPESLLLRPIPPTLFQQWFVGPCCATFMNSDDLRHYISCRPLWSAANSELSKFFPWFHWLRYMDKIQILGFYSPFDETIFWMLSLRVAVISHTYHACKTSVCTDTSVRAVIRVAIRRYNQCLPTSLRSVQRD